MCCRVEGGEFITITRHASVFCARGRAACAGGGGGASPARRRAAGPPLHPWFMVERVCVELCWVLAVNIHTLLSWGKGVGARITQATRLAPRPSMLETIDGGGRRLRLLCQLLLWAKNDPWCLDHCGGALGEHVECSR